jgi:hypothetical protein
LRRDDAAGPTDIDTVARQVSQPDPASVTQASWSQPAADPSPGLYADGSVRLLDATLVAADDGATDVDGPGWILRTVWLSSRAVRSGTRLEFTIQLRDGSTLHRSDVADLWWNPPPRWTVGQPVTIDVPDIPVRKFVSWQASFD